MTYNTPGWGCLHGLGGWQPALDGETTESVFLLGTAFAAPSTPPLPSSTSQAGKVMGSPLVPSSVNKLGRQVDFISVFWKAEKLINQKTLANMFLFPIPWPILCNIIVSDGGGDLMCITYTEILLPTQFSDPDPKRLSPQICPETIRMSGVTLVLYFFPTSSNWQLDLCESSTK